MLHRFLLLLVAIPLVAQLGPLDLRWRTVGAGAIAARPSTCIANRHVYICNGSGCTAGNNIHYCTATDTWVVQDGSGDVSGAAQLTNAGRLVISDGDGTVSEAGFLSTDVARLSQANAFTDGQTILKTALGATTAIGARFSNTTAAAEGAQQVSPTARWTGQGWKTDATAASQAVEFHAYVLPVEGAAAPTGVWKLQRSINAGAFADVFTVTTGGVIQPSGGYNAVDGSAGHTGAACTAFENGLCTAGT